MLLTNILPVGEPRLRMFSKYCLFFAHYKTKHTAYSERTLRKQNIPQQCFIKGEDLKNIFKIFIKVQSIIM